MSYFRKATLGLAGVMLAGAAWADAGDLVVFDWAGYEDPEFYASYIEKYGGQPTFSFFADEEEAFQKMRSGFKADGAHPCSQSVPKWLEAGLLRPLDTSRIENWDDLEPQFREIEAYKKDGEYYFVPIDWGNTALTYNTELLTPDQVQSLRAFADPAHAGRVSLPDNVDDAYALGFLAIGVKDWTKATDEEFEAASDFLREVHKNVRSYWDAGSSLAQLMQSGEVYLAWAWNETYATMSAEGHPIVMKRDTDEGSSSWVCGYTHLANGTGVADDQFYDFINAWLEPRTVEYIVSAWGYGHANTVAMAAMDQDIVKAMGLDMDDTIRSNTLWQGPVGPVMREKMIAEFELIKAGF